MLLSLSRDALQEIIQMHEGRPVPAVSVRIKNANAGLAMYDYGLAAQRALMRHQY